MSIPYTFEDILRSAKTEFEQCLLLQKISRPPEAIFKKQEELAHLPRNSPPSSILADFLTSEERQSIAFRLKEMQEIGKGQDKYDVYSNGKQLDTVKQLEKICEGVSSPQVNRLRLIKIYLLSYLIQTANSPTISHLVGIKSKASTVSFKTALKETALISIENFLLEIIDEVITFFFEFENYLRKTNQEDHFNKAVDSLQSAAKKLQSFKLTISATPAAALLENLDKASELLQLLETCFSDRKLLLPLLLKSLVNLSSDELNFLSPKGWQIFKMSINNCLFGTRAILRKSDELIKTLKNRLKEKELLTPINRGYLEGLEKVFKQYENLQMFIHDQLINHPSFREACGMVQEAQFDLVKFKKFYSLCCGLENNFQNMSRQIVYPILDGLKNAFGYFNQQVVLQKLEENRAKPSDKSFLSEQELGVIYRELGSATEQLKSLPNSYGRDLQFEMGVFLTQCITSASEFFEKELEQYQQFHEFNTETTDPLLLKSQSVCESDLFCLKVHQILRDFVANDQMGKKEKELLEIISDTLRDTTYLLQVVKDTVNFSSKELTQKFEIIIQIKSLLDQLEKILKESKEIKNFPTHLLFKIASIEKMIALFLPLINFASKSAQGQRIAIYMFFSPLGSDLNLTPALLNYFDQVLEHAYWAAKKITLEEWHTLFYENRDTTNKLLTLVPPENKITFKLVLNKFSAFIDVLLNLKKEILQFPLFSKDKDPQAAVQRYTKLLLTYKERFQKIEIDTWSDALKELFVKISAKALNLSDQISPDLMKIINEVVVFIQLEALQTYFSEIVIPINSSIFAWLKTASILNEEKAKPSPVFSIEKQERKILHNKPNEPETTKTTPAVSVSSAVVQPTQVEQTSLKDFALILERTCLVLRTFHLSEAPSDEQQEYLLRRAQMSESLQNLEGYYLAGFKELGSDVNIKKTPYLYIETLYLRSALTIEQTVKFLLAYYPFHNAQSKTHILFSWTDQKQIRSQHNLITLLQLLQEGLLKSKVEFKLSEGQLESLGFFHHIIGSSSRSLENSYTPESALLRQISLWSYLSHAHQNNQLSFEEKQYLETELGKDTHKWEEQIQREIESLYQLAEKQVSVALSTLFNLLHAIAPKAPLEIKNPKEISETLSAPCYLPTQHLSSLGGLLKEIKEVHEQVNTLCNTSVKTSLEWNATQFNLSNKHFRERQLFRTLADIPHYLIILNELLDHPSAWMTYLTADALMLKTALVLEMSIKALLCHFDIPSEQNAKCHLLLEVIENSAQTRLRLFDHDLKVMFGFLEKALKERQIDSGIDTEMQAHLFTLRFFIGTLNRYPSAQKERGKAADILEKLKELSSLQSAIKEGFFTSEQYSELHKKGSPDQWASKIEQDIQSVYDKEIYPLISNCLHAAKKMLEILNSRLSINLAKK